MTTIIDKPIHNVEAPVVIDQSVAVLVDGNNIEISIHKQCGHMGMMLNFDKLVPKLIGKRTLNRFIYFREGNAISDKFADRLRKRYHGTVYPCGKSADIPLSMTAVELANKVDTIIIFSGDSDYIRLIKHLKLRGLRVEIAAVEATTSEALKREADYFYAILPEDCYRLG